MQTVRTSITLPKGLHDELKEEAFLKGDSLNSVLVQKLQNKSKMKKRKKIMDEMQELVKNVDVRGIDYKALVEDGRRF